MPTPPPLIRRHPDSAIELIVLHSAHSFPRHSHDQYGVGRLSQGAQRSYSGRGTVEAQAGDIIMVNPAEMHDGQPLHCETRSWQMLYFPPPLLAEAADAANLSPFGQTLLPPVSQDRQLAICITRLITLLQAPHTPALALDEAETEVLWRLLRFPRSPEVPAHGHAYLERVRQQLCDSSETSLRLGMLAEQCDLSPYQLLRQFRQQYGITPHAYWSQHRLQMARRLLLGNAPLADIAQQCGFADQSHLTRAFKRQYGLPPGRYRQPGR
jgi:AraC-like DNA-binding protein